jgi:hypothetical protein
MSGRWTLFKKSAWVGALVLSLGSLAAAVPALAHHSMAMFDQTKEVTVTGTVKLFQWTNPHSYIQLNVPDQNGRTVEWSLELGAPMYLYSKGWRPKTLKAGEKISVRIYPLRSGQPGGAVVDVSTADGKSLANLRS